MHIGHKKKKHYGHRKKGLALTGFFLGFISLLTFWVPIIGTLFSFLAIVFSKMGYRRAVDDPEDYSGKLFAALGIAMGFVFLISSIVTLLLVGGIFAVGYFAGYAISDYIAY